MKKKDIKALKGIEQVLNEDYERLCDRIHGLELSHKRMLRLLRACEIEFFDVLENCPTDFKVTNPFSMLARVQHMVEVLNRELGRRVL